MTNPADPSVRGLADQVVQSDVTAQQAIGTWEKGTWTRTTQIATGGGLNKAIVVLLVVVVLAAGLGTGYLLFNQLPAPSATPTTVAAPPSASPTASPVTASPVPATSTPTASPVTASPVPATATPTATATATATASAAPIALPPGLDQVVTGEPVAYDDDDGDGGIEGPDDPDPGPQPQTELAGGYIAPGSVTNGQAVAMLDGSILATVRSAQVDELWPCTGDGVFCGPAELEPGDYFVIGFSTAAPPPTSSPESIYQVFYVMTDLDGNWTNNAPAGPPNTNNIYLSAQYVIEGGWYGPTKGLGETDYQGPVGPDGQTPRYNQAPASRLVLTQDPPGGFFLVPQDRVGSWFRIATMWRDFGEERSIRTDAIAAQGPLGMIPVPGRAELPSTLSCARVDIVQAAPAPELRFTFQVAPGEELAIASTADVTLTQTQPSQADFDTPGLAIEDLGNGVYAFNVPSPAAAGAFMFNSIIVNSDDQPSDLTEEFIVLTGAGVGVRQDAEGFALGDPQCGT